MAAPPPKAADGKPDLSGIWRNERPPLLVPTQLTEEGRQLVGRFRATQDDNRNANRTRCLPHFPSYLIPGGIYKIVQTPGLIVLLDEAQGLPLPRQIFIDGRPLPTKPNPTWMGYSVGHWEKDQLVVETIGFNNRVVLPSSEGGFPLTEQTRITERFERLNFGQLQVQVTFDDPLTYTKPWSFSLTQRFQADTELLEWVCENNDDILRHMVSPR